MKYLTAIFVLFILLLPAFAYSESTDTVKKAYDTYINADPAVKITYLRLFGQELIKERTDSLTQVKEGINKFVRLNPEDKSAVLADVNNQITALNSQKVNIDKEQDLTKAKDEVTSIYGAQVYKTVIPKIYLSTINFKMDYDTAELYTAITKAEAMVGNLKTAGKDTTNLEKQVADTRLVLGEVKNNILTVKTSLETISGDDQAQNTQIISKATSDMALTRQKISAATRMLKGIVSSLANSK